MSQVEQIKDAIRIEDYLQSRFPSLKHSGHLFKMCCPMHEEKTPSFVVNAEKQSWHCYGACAKGGDVIAFAMGYDRLSFGEALQSLADYAHIDLAPMTPQTKQRYEKEMRFLSILETASDLYADSLFHAFGCIHHDYLTRDRGLTYSTLKEFEIGYAYPTHVMSVLRDMGYSEDELVESGLCARDEKTHKLYERFRDRCMFPIKDHKGRVVSFGARSIDGTNPKYINGPETEVFRKSKILYGFDTARRAHNAHSWVLVEGYMDVLQSRQNGIFDTIAAMGIGLSEFQFDLLAKGGTDKIILCLDGDVAGRKALSALIEKYIHPAANKGIALYAMFAPFGKDIDETLRTHPELWASAVESAHPALDVLIDIELRDLGSNPNAVQKSALARRLLPILKGDNPFVTAESLKTLASRTETPVDKLTEWVSSQACVLPKPLLSIVHPVTLPTNEEWILHALLANDEAFWLERANARLDTVTTDVYSHALAPLSINDFIHKNTRMIMSQITRLVAEGQRPLHETVKAYFQGGNNYEIYERIEATEVRSRILGGPGGLDYDAFIGTVFEVRIVRLRRDIKDGVALDQRLVRECQNAIALLSLACEEMPI